VLGTVSGFATSVGRPEPAQLELARLYVGYVASAIERERLLTEVSRRNRVLESLRAMLETLVATPDRAVGGLGASLLALSRALGAVGVAVLIEKDGELESRVVHDAGAVDPGAMEARYDAAARSVLAAGTDGKAQFVEPGLAAVALRHPEGRAALVAHLPTGDSHDDTDTLELLGDATRSLALAMEGEALEHTRREAAALRRSQGIQRELLSSLSHELRTPLTAIQGYASTLLQPDLTWDAASTDRFLRSIATEGARLGRLVGDLLDSTAIESGVLRLQRHWCDVRLVVEAAMRLVADGSPIRVHADADLEPVWGDHDRLEQVFVNLLENAVAHGASPDGIDVTLRRGASSGTVEVEVSDHGPGIPRALADHIFEPRVRDATRHHAGAGLGLPIAKGIVDAHGGTLASVPAACGACFVVALPCEPPTDASVLPLDASWSLVDAPKEPDGI
jgi:K+-sensing histidine kinase KdpD